MGTVVGTCDYEGCDAYPDGLDKYDQRLYHCSGCDGDYQFCDKHCTEINIAQHCLDCHANKESCGDITFQLLPIRPKGHNLATFFANYKQY